MAARCPKCGETYVLGVVHKCPYGDATNEQSPASSPNTQQEVVPSEACAAASKWVRKAYPKGGFKVVPSPFGDRYDFSVPDGADCVVVFVRDNCCVPVRILLPHQLYVETIEKIIAEHYCSSVMLLPCRSLEWMEVAEINTELAEPPTEGNASTPAPTTPCFQEGIQEGKS
jgi:hypothetical protein